jgi:hypothetical protein
MRFCRAYFFIILVLYSAVASARLGDSWRVIQLGGDSNFSYTKTVQNGFTVYTYGSDSTLLVHEYTNALGVVFAVHWSGYYLPNFDKLLSDRYLAKLNEAGALYLNKSSLVNKEGFIFKSTGKMRSFTGYAVDTLLMPSGFDLGRLQ